MRVNNDDTVKLISENFATSFMWGENSSYKDSNVQNWLNKKDLEREIKQYWSEYKFKDQQLQYGTITKIFEHGKSGFITSDDNESLYFNVYEFKGDNLDVGQYVSFFTEKSFDKSKNKESLKAVNIRSEI